MKLSWHSEKRKLSELIPSEYNPRKATEKQAKDLSKSLEKFDLADPIIINTDNHVVGGHFRLRILKDKGEDIEVDVRVPNRKLTDKEERELNIRLNKNTGQFDYELLANFDEELLLDTGFESVELDKIFQLDTDKTEDDFDADAEAEKIKNCIVKRGDIYQLGDHRLMCGDATSKEDVSRLMGSEKADMVFTDPPYNINFGYKGYSDNKSMAEYKSLCNKWFNIFSQYPLIFTPGPRNVSLYPEPKDIGTWVKRGGKTGASCFNLRYCEPILFYGKFIKKRTTDLFEHNTGDFSTLNSTRSSLGINTKKKHREYAPAKPIKLIVDIIESYSNRMGIIIDCFGGNGTTLIACEQTNRKCMMMEIDPLYCQVIITRWETLTGKKEVKL